MEYKLTPFFSSVKDIDGRDVTGIASVFGNIDDGWDISHSGMFKKTIREQQGRIRHLWQHDFYSPPIATVKNLQEVGVDALPSQVRKVEGVTGGLEVTRSYLSNDRAQEVFEGIASGAINEMSFAFDPQKYDFEELEFDDGKGAMVRHLREVRLWETSDVIWGMNSLTSASKNWLPAKKTGHLRKDAEWLEPTLQDFTDMEWEDLPDSEKQRIAEHYAWTDSAPVQKFSDLRYAHHKPSKSGVGPIIYAGVLSALKLFATDATGLLEPDFGKVYDHLASHLQEYNEKTFPLELVMVHAASIKLIEQGLLPEGELLNALDVVQDLTLQWIHLAEQPKADRTLTSQLQKRAERMAQQTRIMEMRGYYG